jgi:hypothetical protein
MQDLLSYSLIPKNIDVKNIGLVKYNFARCFVYERNQVSKFVGGI